MGDGRHVRWEQLRESGLSDRATTPALVWLRIRCFAVASNGPPESVLVQSSPMGGLSGRSIAFAVLRTLGEVVA